MKIVRRQIPRSAVHTNLRDKATQVLLTSTLGKEIWSVIENATRK